MALRLASDAPFVTRKANSPVFFFTGRIAAKASEARGETRIYRVESKDSLQTLSRAEADGRFYLNFVKLEKARALVVKYKNVWKTQH